MIKEIYTRTPDDPYYVEGIIDYSNEVESILSQIKLLLETQEGDVLGAYNFGTDLEYLIFNTKQNGEEIISKLHDKIDDFIYYNSDNISIDFAINFGDSGLGYDIAVLDIYINGQKSIGFLFDPQN